MHGPFLYASWERRLSQSEACILPPCLSWSGAGGLFGCEHWTNAKQRCCRSAVFNPTNGLVETFSVASVYRRARRCPLDLWQVFRSGTLARPPRVPLEAAVVTNGGVTQRAFYVESLCARPADPECRQRVSGQNPAGDNASCGFRSEGAHHSGD